MDVKDVRWPGWEVIRPIGSGSFGAVYEIQRDVLGITEKAALKVITIPQNSEDIQELRNEGYDEESITATFKTHLKSIMNEYALMRKMKGCTNVVDCDDFQYVQHDDGIGWDIYIKMELLTPMVAALPQDIPEQTVRSLASDICKALVLCKRFDIVHRDIKPQNIFVSELGDYKLGDFGIAKTVEKTSGGTKIGTYKYIAPEVYNNRPYNSTADIYSLGLVLYWMLNERRMPFLPLPPEKLTVSIDEQARARRLSGERIPAPAHGSEELKRIVLKACSFEPKDRYGSAEAMLADLQKLSAPAEEKPQNDVNVSPNAEVPAEEEEGTVGAFAAIPVKEPETPAAQEAAPEEEEGTVGAFAAVSVKEPEPPAVQDEAPQENENTVGAFSTVVEKKQLKNTASAEDAPPDHKKSKKKTKKIILIACAALLLLAAGFAAFMLASPKKAAPASQTQTHAPEKPETTSPAATTRQPTEKDNSKEPSEKYVIHNPAYFSDTKCWNSVRPYCQTEGNKTYLYIEIEFAGGYVLDTYNSYHGECCVVSPQKTDAKCEYLGWVGDEYVSPELYAVRLDQLPAGDYSVRFDEIDDHGIVFSTVNIDFTVN